jgi:hypothetical protein
LVNVGIKRSAGRFGFALGASFLAEIEGIKVVGKFFSERHIVVPALGISMLAVALGTFGFSCFYVGRQWSWKALLWPPILVVASFAMMMYESVDGTGYKHLAAILVCGGLLAIGTICTISSIFANRENDQKGIDAS